MNITLLLALSAATNSFSLPPGLLKSICFVESSNKPRVIHKDDGAENSIGLCQIHSSTARWLGYSGDDKGLLDPKVNTHYAAKYLKYQIDRYKQDLPSAVAAYNAGRCNRNKNGKIRNIKYVLKVYKEWEKEW